MIDMTQTIIPKSDQLNADDLIGKNLTIKITNVAKCKEPEQPISLNFEGDCGKPFKPCKSMRRVMVNIWGPDGMMYIGRSLTIYRDNDVQFGGLKVGGIRISHASHIDKPITMALTATRANRKPFTVKPLIITQTQTSPPPVSTDPNTAAREFAEKIIKNMERASNAEKLAVWLADAQNIQARADIMGVSADLGNAIEAAIKAACCRLGIAPHVTPDADIPSLDDSFPGDMTEELKNII